MITKQITRDELEKIYNTHTINEACEILGTTMHTFYKMIDSAGIPRRRKAYREQVRYEITE